VTLKDKSSTKVALVNLNLDMVNDGRVINAIVGEGFSRNHDERTSCLGIPRELVNLSFGAGGSCVYTHRLEERGQFRITEDVFHVA
jgi:hypothetical protein